MQNFQCITNWMWCLSYDPMIISTKDTNSFQNCTFVHFVNFSQEGPKIKEILPAPLVLTLKFYQFTYFWFKIQKFTRFLQTFGLPSKNGFEQLNNFIILNAWG